MFTALALTLAQASQPSVTYLTCDEIYNDKVFVWNITLNEGQGWVEYGIVQPEARGIRRVAAAYGPRSVTWNTGKPHPITGLQTYMAVSRMNLQMVLEESNLAGEFLGFRKAQCTISLPEERAF